MPHRAVWKTNSDGQKAFVEDLENRYIGLSGGWYSGKSYIGARKLLSLHLINNSCEHQVQSLVMAPSYRGLDEYCIPHIIDACEECNIKCSYHFGRKEIIFPDFDIAPIILRSAEDPSRITGFTVGAAWLDEAARYKSDFSNPLRDPLLQATGRLRDYNARYLQMLLTFTPEGIQTGVHHFFENNNDVAKLYTVATHENKYAKEFYEAQSRHLSKDLQDQYLHGQAIDILGGVAYSNFTRSLHICSDLGIDTNYPICLALDFNTIPGQNAIVFQYYDKFFKILTEFTGKGLKLEQICKDLVRFINHKEFPGIEIYGDPAGIVYGSFNYVKEILTSKYCIPEDFIKIRTKTAPPVTRRVNAFQSVLRNSDGKSHISIDENCKNLVRDLELVRFSDKAGSSYKLNKSDNSLTHLSDALGYAIELLHPLRIIPSNAFQKSKVVFSS